MDKRNRYTRHNDGNKMTKDRHKKYPDPKIYQSSMTPDQRGYVDAAVHAQLTEMLAPLQKQVNHLTQQIVLLKDRVQQQDDAIAAIRAYYEADDRFVLTRAKIIHFMKKLGRDLPEG